MIYTSRLEPFRLAPLEANACGTPVVGIAEGGIRETVRHGISGFVSADDDPHRLGDLVRRFIDDLRFAIQMGAQARDYVATEWSMAKCTDNIESHLSTLRNATKAKALANSQMLREASNNIRSSGEDKTIPNGGLLNVE
jgi:glycosyltransferase involved in cell wall biosynthesis